MLRYDEKLHVALSNQIAELTLLLKFLVFPTQHIFTYVIFEGIWIVVYNVAYYHMKVTVFLCDKIFRLRIQFVCCIQQLLLSTYFSSPTSYPSTVNILFQGHSKGRCCYTPGSESVVFPRAGYITLLSIVNSIHEIDKLSLF